MRYTGKVEICKSARKMILYDGWASTGENGKFSNHPPIVAIFHKIENRTNDKFFSYGIKKKTMK